MGDQPKVLIIFYEQPLLIRIVPNFIESPQEISLDIVNYVTNSVNNHYGTWFQREDECPITTRVA